MTETILEYLDAVVDALSGIEPPEYNFDVLNVQKRDRFWSAQAERPAIRVSWIGADLSRLEGTDTAIGGSLQLLIDSWIDYDALSGTPTSVQNAMMVRDIQKALLGLEDNHDPILESVEAREFRDEDSDSPAEGVSLTVRLNGFLLSRDDPNVIVGGGE